MKIYISALGELVVDRGGNLKAYPAFFELFRVNYSDDKLSIVALYNSNEILVPTSYTELQDEAGTAYGSFAALWTALDSYFDNEL